MLTRRNHAVVSGLVMAVLLLTAVLWIAVTVPARAAGAPAAHVDDIGATTASREALAGHRSGR